METFVIKINGVDTDVVRNEEYKITYDPISEDIETPVTISGIVLSRSIDLGMLRVQAEKQTMLIPIKNIQSMEKI